MRSKEQGKWQDKRTASVYGQLITRSLSGIAEGVVLVTSAWTELYRNTHLGNHHGPPCTATQRAALMDCSARLQTQHIKKAFAFRLFRQIDKLRRSLEGVCQAQRTDSSFHFKSTKLLPGHEFIFLNVGNTFSLIECNHHHQKTVCHLRETLNTKHEKRKHNHTPSQDRRPHIQS